MKFVPNTLVTIVSISFGIIMASSANARSFDQLTEANGFPAASHWPGGGKVISLFRRIDTDNDGLLSLAEVTSARLKRSSHRFRRIDTDNDGLVSLEEYLAATASRQDKFDEYGEALFTCVEETLGVELPDPDTLPTPEERFDEIDTDADGFVSQAELEEFLTLRVAEKFTAADLNGDSYISWDEFKPAAEFRINRRRAVKQCIEELTEEGETLEDLIGSEGVRSVSPL